jgi:hypothetical protein
MYRLDCIGDYQLLERSCTQEVNGTVILHNSVRKSSHMFKKNIKVESIFC